MGNKPADGQHFRHKNYLHDIQSDESQRDEDDDDRLRNTQIVAVAKSCKYTFELIPLILTGRIYAQWSLIVEIQNRSVCVSLSLRQMHLSKWGFNQIYWIIQMECSISEK